MFMNFLDWIAYRYGERIWHLWCVTPLVVSVVIFFVSMMYMSQGIEGPAAALLTLFSIPMLLIFIALAYVLWSLTNDWLSRRSWEREKQHQLYSVQNGGEE